MKIQELMTRDVAVCRADDHGDHAACLMWDHDCGVIPVVDDENRPIGIVTDRDLCMAAWMSGRKLAEIRVGDVMSADVQSCEPMDTVESAERMMRKRHVRRLPVVDARNRLAGIVSMSDIARHAARSAGRTDGGLSAHDVTETLAAICKPWAQIDRADPAGKGASPRECVVSVPVMAR